MGITNAPAIHRRSGVVGWDQTSATPTVACRFHLYSVTVAIHWHLTTAIILGVETPFGVCGDIVPPFHKSQSWDHGSFQLSVENGVIAIGFEDEALADKAREVVKMYLAAHNLENGTNYHVDLNRSWQPQAGSSRRTRVDFSEELSMTPSFGARVVRATNTGRARIVSPGFDSETLDNQTVLVDKCLKDRGLASALAYFNDEVIEDDRPQYGIYKAIEALTKELPGGREALGRLAGRDKRYVTDVTQTAQLTRHHDDPDANRVITDEECKERAKILIRAYASKVQI